MSIGQWRPVRNEALGQLKNLPQSHCEQTLYAMLSVNAPFYSSDYKWVVCRCRDFELKMWRQEETLLFLLMSGHFRTLSSIPRCHWRWPFVPPGCHCHMATWRKPCSICSTWGRKCLNCLLPSTFHLKADTSHCPFKPISGFILCLNTSGS